MTWRDIAGLFEDLEIKLISSLRHNLEKHRAWEKEEGFNWSAWQADKLKAIRKYTAENQELINRVKSQSNTETEALLNEQYEEGMLITESEKEANGGKDISPVFHGVNRNKVDAIISESLGIQDRAEKAALRMMNDIYRDVVAKVSVKMSTGSMTLPSAIDEAVQDFLSRGINCIEYKNGRRVNIADYVHMALQTAATRSYLCGEAAKRKALGIDTVLVSQYGGCSPTCLPYQGKVYIDDVWGDFDGPINGSMGRSRNGKWYMLLSAAIKGGLFHPNCRHTLSTWFEGVSRMPELLNAAVISRNYALEQKQRKMEQNIRRLKRLCEGTSDSKQNAIYKKRLGIAQKDIRAFIAENGNVLRRDYWRERTFGIPANAVSTAEMSEGKQYLRVSNAATADKGALRRMIAEKQMLPREHISLLNNEVTEVQIVEQGHSSFNSRTKVLTMQKDFVKGEYIHECGHAMYYALGLDKGSDARYNRIVEKVIESSIVKVFEREGVKYYALDGPHIISDYQGWVGTRESSEISPEMLREYFSEGYREYFVNPENLKRKDLDLFNFIEGIGK